MIAGIAKDLSEAVALQSADQPQSAARSGERGDQLVEIALRALSPAVNDTFTRAHVYRLAR